VPGGITSATETENGVPGAVVRTFYRGVLYLGMSRCFMVDTLDVVVFTTV
jgi:hypothetical protein